MNPTIIPVIDQYNSKVNFFKYALTLLAFVLMTSAGWAQQFETTLGIPATLDEAADSKPIDGGKYILLGNTQSFGQAGKIVLTRLNGAGVQEFTAAIYDANNQSVAYSGTAIELDRNNTGVHTGYFITGYRKNGNVNQVLLLRTDLNGAVSWVKYLPGSSQHDERGVSVERQSNGDVIVVGNSKNITSTANLNEFLVSRFSAAGAQIWSHRYGTGTGAGSAYCEALEACNGFGGNNLAVIAVTGKTSTNHTFLSCINAATGLEIWRKLYSSGLSADQGTDVVYKAANGATEPAAFMVVGSAGAPHPMMWVVRVNPNNGAGSSKYYAPGISASGFSATAVTLDPTGAKAAIAGRILAQGTAGSLTNAVFAMVLPFYGTELPEWTRYYTATSPAGTGKESISRISSGGYFIGCGARLSGAVSSDLHAIRTNNIGENGFQSCATVKITPTKTVAGTTQNIPFVKTANAWTSYILTRTPYTFLQESCGTGLTPGSN